MSVERNPTRSTKTALATHQAAWATDNGVPLGRPGYAAALTHNLFDGRLHPDTHREFAAADGGELLDRGTRPAKMRALISSSALVVNFFDHWRERVPHTFSEALGLPGQVRELRFEYRCAEYPFPRRPPNLDLLLTLTDGHHVAVECKFTEPYAKRSDPTAISARYFQHPEGLWLDSGLERAQYLADTLAPRWETLDVAQLLKHMLGLTRDSHVRTPELLYLWFDAGTPAAVRHRQELEDFSKEVEGDPVRFRAVTYQTVFATISRGEDVESGPWIRYMRDRYFPNEETGLRNAAPRTLGALFREVPENWGLRGDPYLWREMEVILAARPLPRDGRSCRVLLERTFEQLVGQPLVAGDERMAYVRRYEHGGMSSGWVSMDFWQRTAIPEILQRLEASQSR